MHSTQAAGAPRCRRRRLAPGFWLLPAFFLLVPLRGRSEVVEDAAAPVADEALEPCEHCAGEGRRECPQCGGAGKLEKACPQCGGSGARPCAVCNRSDGARGPGAGSVACGYCGGKGFTTSVSARCRKCGGTGIHDCSACQGQGELRCRKTVYDGICPTCGFAGSVECGVCEGRKHVRRRVQTATAAGENAEEHAEEHAEPALGAGSVVMRDAAPEREGIPGPSRDQSTDELDAQFESLGKLREEGSRLEIQELKRHCDMQFERARHLLARLGRKTPPGILRENSRTLEARARDLRRRVLETARGISRLGETIVLFDRAYARCEQSRNERPQSPPAARAEAALATWAGRFAFLVKACQRSGDRLVRAAEQVRADARGIDAELKTLEEKADELDRLRVEEAEAYPAAPRASATPEPISSPEPKATSAPRAGGSEPRGAVAGSLLYGLLGALAGFGGATALFLFLRTRTRAPEWE